LFDAEVTTRHGDDARSFLRGLTGERVEAPGR
jgi:hypothetical protein